MDSKLHNQLEEAKVHFRSWRLLESYHILRRYFDRLPFQPEKEHAEYIGIFVRVLLELGKEFELKFYMKELERHYEISKRPEIGYPLGMIFCFISEPRLETARGIFERIVRDPEAKGFHAKAKMMLAHYYETTKADVSTLRMIIDSIQPPEDADLRVMVEIWKAKILREEKRFEEAEAAYQVLLQKLNPQTSWYNYTTTCLQLAYLHLKRGEKNQAETMLKEIRSLFEGRPFKLTLNLLAGLEQLLNQNATLGTIYFEARLDHSLITYANRSLVLKRDSPLEKLLLLMSKKKHVDKTHMVKAIYQRGYVAEQDDKLIYYHIHSLRKRLRDLGVPAEAIEIEASGYRLVPNLEQIGEEL